MHSVTGQDRICEKGVGKLVYYQVNINAAQSY